VANVIINDSPEALAERVALDFLAMVRASLNTEGRPPGWPTRFRIALAGGLTPKLFYARLAQPPYRELIPWEKLMIFWGDERCVAKDHPDSNFAMAQTTLLSQVPVKADQVFRMRGDDPPPAAAKDYEKVLRQQFGPAAPWPDFDLILLGMGQDGHTASLLPGTSALTEFPTAPPYERRMAGFRGEAVPPRWVVHNVIRSLQTVRLTLTLPAINHAKAVWFLVTGAKKAAAFSQVQQGASHSCPASLVRPVRGDLRWYVDRAVVGA